MFHFSEDASKFASRKSSCAQPWWKTTDIDELAYLVSQKLLNHVENCDLPPPPRKIYLEAKENLDSGLIHREMEPSSNRGNFYISFDKSSSYDAIHESDTDENFEGDQSKAQLMEALCYSQTRAREAEELAKQAFAEKEHIVALFFIQASHLFAYKQWCRLLHLEGLNTQIKNSHTSVSTLDALPSMSIVGKKPLMRKGKIVDDKHEKLGKLKNDVSTTYDVAFALGLSLVGAGLLLGWTVGWMLPRM
ncbi:uncharacterized protein LOC127076091 isoform X2 [Lathyrus oleraceus]|uniref:Uncharacterized protein n=1 Tax=Pisum sativum TaxID=3888 RepID=A0A9D5ART5_PEA|nr:uncharacterized protein LOC127076091 isoform X2 [Pisum sativum]KAI5422047.1 hypothetical protein KIW84_045482 [Pisum sativum]